MTETYQDRPKSRHKFKPGDQVRCIEGSLATLIEGNVYTVKSVDRSLVYLEGVPHNWRADRFVPADDPAPAPVGLNPFEWNPDGPLGFADTVQTVDPVVAWARFCWWCAESNIAAHFLPTKPATRTYTMTVDIPRAIVKNWSECRLEGDWWSREQRDTIKACRAALAGEA